MKVSQAARPSAIDVVSSFACELGKINDPPCVQGLLEHREWFYQRGIDWLSACQLESRCIGQHEESTSASQPCWDDAEECKTPLIGGFRPIYKLLVALVA